MRRGRGTSSGCSLGWLVMREEQGVRLAEVTVTPGTGLVKVRGQYESGFVTQPTRGLATPHWRMIGRTTCNHKGK
jgi:hypothetical protein